MKILPGFEFLHPFGWTGFRGRGTLPNEFSHTRYKLYRIDVAAGTIQFAHNITIKTSPFWGTIGVAPSAESRAIPNGVPGVHAGNQEGAGEDEIGKMTEFYCVTNLRKDFINHVRFLSWSTIPTTFQGVGDGSPSNEGR